MIAPFLESEFCNIGGVLWIIIVLNFKEEIINLYSNKKMGILKISKLLGLNEHTVRRHLIFWGVKLRNLSESKIGFDINNFKEDIIYKYIEENMTIEDISFIYNVNHCVIKRLLESNNVNIKTTSEIHLEFNMEIEKENIVNSYVNENKSCNYISQLYNGKISSSTINNWLKRWGVKLRDNSSSKKGLRSGLDNSSSKNIDVLNSNNVLIGHFDTIKECATWLIHNGVSNNMNSVLNGIARSIKNNKAYKNKYTFKKY